MTMWPDFLSWEEKCQLLRIDNPLGPWECSVDPNDNWPLFQFPMKDPCNPGWILSWNPAFCMWPDTTPSSSRVTWAHVFPGHESTSLKLLYKEELSKSHPAGEYTDLSGSVYCLTYSLQLRWLTSWQFGIYWKLGLDWCFSKSAICIRISCVVGGGAVRNADLWDLPKPPASAYLRGGSRNLQT